MKKLPILLALAFLAAAVPVLNTGCQSPSVQVDPAGVYHGSDFLAQTDLAITSAYSVLDAFVNWELTNRPLLAGQPQITKAADHIRANAKKWFNSASALRDAYAASPTDGNRANLQRSIAVIQAALAEATAYMALPAPNK